METPTTSPGATVEANGTTLNYEIRGSGPSVLFISGATGDAGHFERVAEELADEFTVITYDRRGNSRSPRPAGWTITTAEEQAADAAALLRGLGLAPAAVFGTSSGAVIGLALVVNHPEVVRGAILHEPALITVLPNAEQLMATAQPSIEEGMKTGGPRGATEAFLRTLPRVDVAALPPALRERMLNNGETLFGVEFGRLESYRPDDATLAAMRVPVRVMLGDQSPEFLIETSRWLAARLGAEPRVLPGGHTPYFDRPTEMAEAIRPFLRRVS